MGDYTIDLQTLTDTAPGVVFFYQSLNDSVTDELAAQDLPTSLGALVELVAVSTAG